jgi:hypothetical protein
MPAAENPSLLQHNSHAGVSRLQTPQTEFGSVQESGVRSRRPASGVRSPQSAVRSVSLSVRQSAPHKVRCQRDGAGSSEPFIHILRLSLSPCGRTDPSHRLI